MTSEASAFSVRSLAYANGTIHAGGKAKLQEHVGVG